MTNRLEFRKVLSSWGVIKGFTRVSTTDQNLDAQADALSDGADNDSLPGFTGNYEIRGDDGDEIISGRIGNDIIDEGETRNWERRYRRLLRQSQ